jgi:hypothetical protein
MIEIILAAIFVTLFLVQIRLGDIVRVIQALREQDDEEDEEQPSED